MFPVGRIVGRDSGARSQKAKKRMLGGIDHNSGVAMPHGEVAGLRICYSRNSSIPASRDPRRRRVFIRKTGALIESVNKMGAVGSEETRMMAGMQRRIQDCQSLIQSERLGLLRQCGREAGHTEQEQQKSAFGIEPHSPYITCPRGATQVTGGPPTHEKCTDFRCTFRVREGLSARGVGIGAENLTARAFSRSGKSCNFAENCLIMYRSIMEKHCFRSVYSPAICQLISLTPPDINSTLHSTLQRYFA